MIFAVVAFVDLPVAAVMLAFALIALFGPSLWHRLEARKALDQQAAYANFAAEFLDSIQGLATLKAFGQSKARANDLEEKATTLFRETMWVLATNVMSRGITDSAIACGAAAALAVGAFRVESGAMELSALLIILLLGVEIYRPMRELRTVLHQGMVGRSAAQGIYQLLDDEPAVADVEPAPLTAPLAPTITFDDVHFRYPGGRRDVHRGLDFTLAAGDRVGVVGPSGGGKSSIVRLLLRFYDPDEGSVRLGGRDLRELSFAQIRSMISVVNQDTFLFHGTIADNLRIGRPDATADDLIEAARAANIHDFVTTLREGYDTVIGEKGIKLSGGQRQRVAIARALLRDTPILVLDEALSAVDAENEAVIGEALDRLMEGRTTLIIAHRLSSVIDCDTILVLDHGRIVERGPHDELLATGGAYASLMAEQAAEAAPVLGAANRTSDRSTQRATTANGSGCAARRTGGDADAAADRGHPQGGRARLGAARRRVAEARDGMEGTARRGVRVRGAPGGGLHRGGRAQRTGGAGAQERRSVPWLPGGAGVRGAAGRDPPLARVVDRPRHGIPPPGRDADRGVPQARCVGSGRIWYGAAPAT